MITGELKSKIDRIWDAFWSGGISNPLEVIEQITYLLFIRRLDDLQTLAENRARHTGKPIENPIFRPGQAQMRWSRFKDLEPGVMHQVIGEEVFPLLRQLGGDGSTYSGHMKDARFTIPTPALLSRVVDMLDDVPMQDRDTNGDLYEYMLSKIATAGQNGQFRTPRHIIQFMVEMTAPQHHPVRESAPVHPAHRRTPHGKRRDGSGASVRVTVHRPRSARPRHGLRH